MNEVSREVKIENQYGLHARPATKFVELANKFQSDILVTKDEQEVNGKSIMGMLMLGAEGGTTLLIKALGDDAAEAIEKLVELVKNKFDED